MPKIFVSYRREDSLDIVGRICDRLTAHFGRDSIFVDVDSIPFGVDFRDYLGNWVGACDLVLAVVGNGWITETDEKGDSRLGQPDDFVTIELAAALGRGIPVIPLLVGHASMPKPDELPPDLAQFAYRNAAEVRSGRDFHDHMDRVIRGIESLSTLPRPGPDVVVIEPPAVARPTNLAFAQLSADHMPRGWLNSFGFVGGVSTRYEVSVESRAGPMSGRCVRMQRSPEGATEFGSLMQRCPAHAARGLRLRIEAELRTKALAGWAGLWLRIDGSDGELFFDNMSDRPVKGTTDWQLCVIETAVPAEAMWLNYGIVLASYGTIWAANFRVQTRDASAQWIDLA